MQKRVRLVLIYELKSNILKQMLHREPTKFGAQIRLIIYIYSERERERERHYRSVN